MFYSTELLHRRRGRFGVLCQDLIDHIMVHVPRGQGQRSRPRFSLYLASQLTYGVIYVYSKQVDFLHRDLQNFISNYKVSLHSIRDNIALPPRTNRGKRVVTLEDRINGDDEFGFIEPPIKRIRTEPRVTSRVEPRAESSVSPGPRPEEDEGFNFDELMREAREPLAELSPPHLPATTISPDRTLVRSPQAITMQETMLTVPPTHEAATGLDFGLATDDDLDILAAEDDIRDIVPEHTPPPSRAAHLPPDAPERQPKPIPQSVTPPAMPKLPTTPETLPEPLQPIPPAVELERTPPSVGEPPQTATPPQPFPVQMPEEMTPPSVGKPPSTTTPPGKPPTPVLRLQDIDVLPRPRRRRRRRVIVDRDIQLPREDVNRSIVDYRRDQRDRDTVTFEERQNQRIPPHVLFATPSGRENFRAPKLLQLFTRNCRIIKENSFTDSPMRMQSPPQLKPEEETEIDILREPSIDVSRQISETGIIATPDISSRTADLSAPEAIDIEPDDTYAMLPTVPEHEELGIATHPVEQEVEVAAQAAEQEVGPDGQADERQGTPEESEAESDAQTSQDKERRAIEALLVKIKECSIPEDILTFRKLCPPTEFMRVHAAKMFSRLLAMHKLSKVYLTQQAPYEDIYIYME